MEENRFGVLVKGINGQRKTSFGLLVSFLQLSPVTK
jgi:hypothetical protein